MRTAIRGGVLVLAGLAHWSCCGCDDKAASPNSPTAAATPTPAPSASPTPSTQSCNLPAVNVDRPPCRPEPPPLFEAQVVRAQDQVRREHPELFDFQGKVISDQSYTGWVATTLRSYGLCAAAVGGAGDEVGVKNTNDFGEQYDIVTGARDTWTNYTVTCRPPLF